MPRHSFWRGSRGEWYLVIQAVLFLLVIFGPVTNWYVAEWVYPFTLIGTVAGGAMFCAGVVLSSSAVINLGRNLTPLPVPKENAALITTGAYRLVRHPIYSGIILMAFGWGLWRHSWLTVCYSLLLLIFFDVKSRFEERLLQERFPDYTGYQRRVRKLLPFVY